MSSRKFFKSLDPLPVGPLVEGWTKKISYEDVVFILNYILGQILFLQGADWTRKETVGTWKPSK